MKKIIDTKIWGTIAEAQEKLTTVNNDIGVIEKALSVINEMSNTHYKSSIASSMIKTKVELSEYGETLQDYIKNVEAQEK